MRIGLGVPSPRHPSRFALGIIEEQLEAPVDICFEILKAVEELPSNQTEPTNYFCKDEYLPILNKSFRHVLEPFFFFKIADKQIWNVLELLQNA